MQEINANIYDFPKYYDLVYGSDWRAEFDFLENCFEKHVPHVVESLFEPACGTGRLLYRFAKAGYQVSGNDLNEKAIEFCNERLERHGFAPTTFAGDMTNFRLSQPVDAAFNTINSFRHLGTNKMAKSHLECMAAAVRKGGIYVLGLHLSPVSGKTCDEESWSASRGHLTVNSSLWLEERNLEKRFEAFNMTFDIYTPTRQFRIRDQVRFRTYQARQFEKLVRQVDRLEIIAAYDFAYEIDRPIAVNDAQEDVVYVLRVVG